MKRSWTQIAKTIFVHFTLTSTLIKYGVKTEYEAAVTKSLCVSLFPKSFGWGRKSHFKCMPKKAWKRRELGAGFPLSASYCRLGQLPLLSFPHLDRSWPQTMNQNIEPFLKPFGVLSEQQVRCFKKNPFEQRQVKGPFPTPLCWAHHNRQVWVCGFFSSKKKLEETGFSGFSVLKWMDLDSSPTECPRPIRNVFQYPFWKLFLNK